MPGFTVLCNLRELAQILLALCLLCYLTISCSVSPFSSCPQSFPALGSFQMSWLFKVLELQLLHQSFIWMFRVRVVSCNQEGLILNLWWISFCISTKKAEHWRTDAFELWCWRRLLRVPWTARRSNQSILKGDQSWVFTGRTDVEAEAPVLWPPDAKSWLIRKDPDSGKDWRLEEKGVTGLDG